MEYPGTVTPLPVVTSITMTMFEPQGTVTPMSVELSYDPADPFAVAAVFDTDGVRIRWAFARELLRLGLFEPAGRGDVHLWPLVDEVGEETVVVELRSPDGACSLRARAVEVAAFLDATARMVPFGTEGGHLDVDGLIAALLA